MKPKAIILDVARLAAEIRALAYNAHMATLVGSPALPTRRFYDATKALEIGDLVVEITTVWMPNRDADSVGYLREVTYEPVDFGPAGELWDEALEGCPHPTEKIFYIDTLDGRRYRWSNANFITAPTKRLSL